MQTQNLLTNEELAQYAPNLDTSAMTAPTISGMINQASQAVASYCNVEGFLNVAVTETQRCMFNTDGDLIVSFRRPRVSQGAVTAVNYKQRAVDYSVTLQTNGVDDYFVDPSGLYMTLPYHTLGLYGTGLRVYQTDDLFCQISYTGGYANTVETLPGDLKRAAVLFLLANEAANTDVTGLKSFRQGSYSETRESGAGNAAETKAQQILDRGGYVRRV